MTESAARRPLEDLLAELAAGLAGIGSPQQGALRLAGIWPQSVEFDLPVEAWVEAGADGPVVVADVPRTRTRTAFDLPLGRLAVRLVAEALR